MKNYFVGCVLLALLAAVVGCATIGKPGDNYPRQRDPESEDHPTHLWAD